MEQFEAAVDFQPSTHDALKPPKAQAQGQTRLNNPESSNGNRTDTRAFSSHSQGSRKSKAISAATSQQQPVSQRNQQRQQSVGNASQCHSQERSQRRAPSSSPSGRSGPSAVPNNSDSSAGVEDGAAAAMVMNEQVNNGGLHSGHVDDGEEGYAVEKEEEQQPEDGLDEMANFKYSKVKNAMDGLLGHLPKIGCSLRNVEVHSEKVSKLLDERKQESKKWKCKLKLTTFQLKEKEVMWNELSEKYDKQMEIWNNLDQQNVDYSRRNDMLAAQLERMTTKESEASTTLVSLREENTKTAESLKQSRSELKEAREWCSEKQKALELEIAIEKSNMQIAKVQIAEGETLGMQMKYERDGFEGKVEQLTNGWDECKSHLGCVRDENKKLSASLRGLEGEKCKWLQEEEEGQKRETVSSFS